MTMLKGQNSLVSLADRIIDVAEQEQVLLADLVHAIGHASFTPLLLFPAIAVTTPLSGIPLFSSVMGLLILLVSVQILLCRNHLWLPQWLVKRKASSARVKAAFKKVRPVMSWLDRHTYERLTALLHRPLVFVPQVLCVFSGLMMPFLEFVPFSLSLVGIAVALLAFGMLARDGVFILLGLLPYLGVLWLVLRLT